MTTKKKKIGRPSQLDDPVIKEHVAKSLVANRKKTDVAKEVGVTYRTMQRIAKREDVQDIMRQQTLKLISASPDALDNILSLVKEFKTTDKSDFRNRDLCYRASERVVTATGVLPGQQSTQVVNITQNNTFTLHPIVESMLDQWQQNVNAFAIAGEVIDGEVQDAKEK